MIKRFLKKIKPLSLTGKILYATGAVSKLETKPYVELKLRKWHPFTIAILAIAFACDFLTELKGAYGGIY